MPLHRIVRVLKQIRTRFVYQSIGVAVCGRFHCAYFIINNKQPPQGGNVWKGEGIKYQKMKFQNPKDKAQIVLDIWKLSFGALCFEALFPILILFY
jgi:hypothetical protein